MRANPHLKVHVACGYHDGATPYYAAEHVLAHLPIPEPLRANISLEYYPAGHMMYVHEPSRLRQSADLATFIRSSVSAAAQGANDNG
jgi:carboxypeptidase C (cathepsin A)